MLENSEAISGLSDTASKTGIVPVLGIKSELNGRGYGDK